MEGCRIDIVVMKDEIKMLILEIQKLKESSSNEYQNLVDYQNLIYEQLIINNNEI